MKKKHYSKPRYKFREIAIVKLSSLGDIIHTIPAWSTLKRAFPGSSFTWVTEPAGAKLLENILDPKEIYVVDLKSKKLTGILKGIRKIRHDKGRSFDLVIDFQGLLKSSILTFILGRTRLGFKMANLKEPVSTLFYNLRTQEFPESNHVIYKNLSLLKGIGINREEIEFPLKEIKESKTVKTFFKNRSITKNDYIIVNIGAGWKTKLLSPEQYIDMIKNLSKKHQVYILWGNEDERERAEYISKMSGSDITPFLDFTDLICFIKNAKVLVSSDSLAMHIGEMVKTPVAGIFGPTSPKRNGPLLTKNVIIHEKVDCSNCYKKYCDVMKCLKDPDLKKIGVFIDNL